MTPFAPDFLTRLADAMRLGVAFLGVAGLVSAALLLTVFRENTHR